MLLINRNISKNFKKLSGDVFSLKKILFEVCDSFLSIV